MRAAPVYTSRERVGQSPGAGCPVPRSPMDNDPGRKSMVCARLFRKGSCVIRFHRRRPQLLVESDSRSDCPVDTTFNRWPSSGARKLAKTGDCSNYPRPGKLLVKLRCFNRCPCEIWSGLKADPTRAAGRLCPAVELPPSSQDRARTGHRPSAH